MNLRPIPVFLTALGLLPLFAEEKSDEQVSYYEQIRPIFQANCHGCHQPAKSKGNYVMTTFERLLQGGEESRATVAEDLFLSNLVTNIEIDEKGEAEMPPKGDPLKRSEIELVKKWIL